MTELDIRSMYDKELRIDIEHPGARREEFPCLVRFIRPAPRMNFISFSRLPIAEADAVIQDQVADLAPRNQPFSWHVCDHDAPPDLKDRLVAHGFAPDEEPDAVMVLALEEDPPKGLESVKGTIRRVVHPAQLDEVVQVESQVLGDHFGWLRRELELHLQIPDYLSIYLAHLDGQAASAGWIYFHPDSRFASLFGGATLPSFRGRGLYRSVLATRVNEAFRRGYRFVVTGANAMSRPILLRTGFRLLTYGHAYEWKGSASRIR